MQTKKARAMKPLSERILDAEHFGSRALADANEANEAGNREKAERLYQKAQFWLDRYNKLAGRD
jgi:hypothetical protein